MTGKKKPSRSRRFAPYVLLAALIGFLIPGRGLIPGVGGPGDFTAALKGQIVSSGAEPVGDAVVRVGKLETRTDAAGRFELSDVDLFKKTVKIKVEKDGYYTKALDHRVMDRERDLGSMTLKRAFYLRGALISEDMNAPIPAGKVRVLRAAANGGNLEVETDADGHYSVGPILEGAPFRVVIEHPAYLRHTAAERVIHRDEENTESRIVLSVGGVISGLARGVDRTPLPRIHVMARRLGSDGSAGTVEKATITGVDGTFLLQGLSAGRKVVTADALDPDLECLPVEVDVAEGGEVTGVEISFKRTSADR